jgi:hypothetical protein
MVPMNVARNAEDRDMAVMSVKGSLRRRRGFVRSAGRICTGK